MRAQSDVRLFGGLSVNDSLVGQVKPRNWLSSRQDPKHRSDRSGFVTASLLSHPQTSAFQLSHLSNHAASDRPGADIVVTIAREPLLHSQGSKSRRREGSIYGPLGKKRKPFSSFLNYR